MPARRRVASTAEFEQNLRRLDDATAGQAMGRALMAGGLIIVNAGKENIQAQGLVLTSTLMRSVDQELTEVSRDRAVDEIGTNLPYAAIHEFGGTIVPVNAQFLRFEIDGVVIFTKSVEIPARPYLRPAFDENIDAAMAEVVATLRILLREALA